MAGPHFKLGGEEVKYQYPITAKADNAAEKLNGNYFFRDDFTAGKLNVRYQFLRTVKENWYSLADTKGNLTIKLRPQTCKELSNPSFIGFHQPHAKGYAATSLNFVASAENEKAGFMIFQNEKAHYFFCKSVKEGWPVLQLYKDSTLLAEKKLPANNNHSLLLKIEAKGNRYAFYYAFDKSKWILFQDNADAVYVSTRAAGGFVGCMYTMYATSNGKPSQNKAVYNWFECKNNDDVYKK